MFNYTELFIPPWLVHSWMWAAMWWETFNEIVLFLFWALRVDKVLPCRILIEMNVCNLKFTFHQSISRGSCNIGVFCNAPNNMFFFSILISTKLTLHHLTQWDLLALDDGCILHSECKPIYPVIQFEGVCNRKNYKMQDICKCAVKHAKLCATQCECKYTFPLLH